MRRRVRRLLLILGPGLLVMLADTDVGSIVTAAQSGVQFGDRLLPLQILLMPALYVVVELTTRLALGTGQGFVGLLRQTIGVRWAGVAVAGLYFSATGALVTELAGLAAVGDLLGLSPIAVVPLTAVGLAVVVLAGKHRQVQTVGIVLGLGELAFVVAAIRTPFHLSQVTTGPAVGGTFAQPGFLTLVAANIGAVVMPWMIFYQQTAVAAGRNDLRRLRSARIDVAIGTVVTQLIMASVLVTAASVGPGTGNQGTIEGLVAGLTPTLGATGGRLLLILGLSGAALVATLVVALAWAWAFAELRDKPHHLDRRFREAPAFYAAFLFAMLIAVVVVLTVNSPVALTIGVEVLNSLLLPAVMVGLLVLARRTLPDGYQLTRVGTWGYIGLTVVVTLTGFGSVLIP